MQIAQPTSTPQPTAQQAPQPAANNNGVLTSDFETFLKMLTVQMQNQDPLNPVESTEYATQLATFSSVEQQVRTNDLLQAMMVQVGAMGMAQLAGWVGMEARAATGGYFDGAPVQVSPNPLRAADQAFLVVTDSLGNEVSRQEIPVSNETLEWAGVDSDGAPLPEGLYTFKVESYSEGELLSSDTAEVYSEIVEARGENGTTVLILEGGAKVDASAVTALRDPTV